MARVFHRLRTGALGLVAALDTTPRLQRAIRRPGPTGSREAGRALHSPKRMKALGCFALRFALLFGLLAWPWPPLRQAVGAVFRAQARFLVGVALPEYVCRVETNSDPQYLTLDAQVVVADLKRIGPDGRSPVVAVRFDSGSQGWIPLAMWIALGVATPLPWSKRVKALLAGALLVQVLVAATVLVAVSFALTTEAWPVWERLVLMFANRLLVENVWFSFVPPFLLWACWLAWGGHWNQLSKRLFKRHDSKVREAQD